PKETVIDLNDTSRVDAGHLGYSAYGDAVDIVHGGKLRGKPVAVEALRKHSGRVCSEELLAVLAPGVGELVEQPFRFGRCAFNNRPIPHLHDGEFAPAYGADPGTLKKDNRFFFSVGLTTMTFMAIDRPPFLLPVFFNGRLLDRDFR